MSDTERFGRYLVGELFWELEQHPEMGIELQTASPESVEVLSFAGYEEVCIRYGSSCYRARLSWRKDTPPVIERIEPREP